MTSPAPELAGHLVPRGPGQQARGRGLEPRGRTTSRPSFNSSIDNNNNCLTGTNWYYGFDGNEGGDVELLPVCCTNSATAWASAPSWTSSTGATSAAIPTSSRPYPGQHHRHALARDDRGQRVTPRSTRATWSGTVSRSPSPPSTSWRGTPVVEINAPPAICRTLTEIGAACFGPPLDDRRRHR